MIKEDLRSGLLAGAVLSFIIGVVIVFILRPTFNSVIFILSLALLPGFFIMSLLYLHKLSKQGISRTSNSQKFDWGVEINLKKLQIVHNRYSSMIQSAVLLATGSFFSMVFIAKDFPLWGTGHEIFFPITTILFIFSLHLAFRWWISMREDFQHLKFQNLRQNM